MAKKYYVTEMLRWGEDETHHYILGVYSTKTKADNAGKAEDCYRGGKYQHRVVECVIDAVDEDAVNYFKRCNP